MKPELSILAGGVLSAALALFHMFFWKVFRWKTDLAKLTSLNRAIVHVLNLCLTFTLIIFAYISIVYRSELPTTGVGRSLLFLMAMFWYLRAMEQLVFFKLRKPISVLFFVLFVMVGFFYSLPLLGPRL